MSVSAPAARKTFLHVGCGPKRQDETTRGFNTDEWTELRFDIDPSVSPDIIGDMTSMTGVADASVDAVFSSHNIEHLYPHDIPVALKEFLRVLKPGGFLAIKCPDLQSICELVAQDKLLEPAYTSPAGPIAPIDILYGYRSSMAQGNLYMAHRWGFSQSTLVKALQEAGFMTVASNRCAHPRYELYAVATKQKAAHADVRALAALHFPGL